MPSELRTVPQVINLNKARKLRERKHSPQRKRNILNSRTFPGFEKLDPSMAEIVRLMATSKCTQKIEDSLLRFIGLYEDPDPIIEEKMKLQEAWEELRELTKEVAKGLRAKGLEHPWLK